MSNRLLFAIAAGALCTAALVANPAQAAVSPGATDAGQWLAGQVTGGLVHNDQYDFDDYGLTLDVLMALQEADTQGPTQGGIVSAMQADIRKYVYNFPSEGPSDGVYAGSAAKVLVAMQAAGEDVDGFGGIDLVTTVEDTVEPSGADKGRLRDRGIQGFPDPSVPADYSNLLYQAYGLQGLAAAGSAEVGDVRDFLLEQQCGPGYFRLYFDACHADTDATAIAIRAMAAAKSDGVDGLDAALAKATGWLVAQQRSDGSFGGGESTPDANTNSTGLAASALALRGRTAQAEKAAAWVHQLQVKRSTGGKLAGEAGAVALAGDAFGAGLAGGIADTTADQWRRATAQAIYGLIHLDPGTIDVEVVEKVVVKVPKPLVRTASSSAVKVSDPDTVADKTDSAQGRLGQYLAGQFSNGDHIEVTDGGTTFTDYDLTADAVLALRQLGQQSALADRASAFLLADKSIDAYAHGSPYEKDASYADALSTLVLVGTLTKDAKPVKDLAAELAGLQQDDGSFADSGKYADGSGDTKRHAIATLALMAAGDGDGAGKAVDLLAAAQCDDGSFPGSLIPDCATGDPGATGWALQAINAISTSDRGVTLAARPDGWSADRTSSVVDAASALNRVVRVDGSIGAADLGTIAAAASGRQAAGLDVRASSLFVAGLQRKDGGLPRVAGGKKSDPRTSVLVASALSPSSMLNMPGTALTSALTLPIAAPAVAAGTSGEISITRPVAYAFAGTLVLLLLLVATGLVLAVRRRVEVPR